MFLDVGFVRLFRQNEAAKVFDRLHLLSFICSGQNISKVKNCEMFAEIAKNSAAMEQFVVV